MRILLASALALLLAPAASAQDLSAEPLFGTIELAAGFLPDPHAVDLIAGGADANPIEGEGCAGNINAERPDVDLLYEAGSLPLYLYVTSEHDTTLLINLPDGSWVCSDDVGGQNPLIALPEPMSGLYDIWIGTYFEEPQEATLHLSEQNPGW